MDRRQATASFVLLALLLPLVPAAVSTAEPQTCDSACAWLPLYVTSGYMPGASGTHGFSSLVGDAMPSDPNTYATRWLDATTHEIDGLSLAREGTFRVELVARDSYEHVQGNISVHAIDAAGSRLLLANAQFSPPPRVGPTESVRANVNNTWNATLGPHEARFMPLLEGALGDFAQRYEGARASLGSGPLSPLADAGYRTICTGGQNHQSPHCRALTGRYGFQGPFDLCAPTPHPAFLPALAWSALDTADGAQAGVTGRRICGVSLFDEANATAAFADEGWPAAAGMLPPAPNRDLVAAPPSSAPPHHRWRDVTMDAAVPAHFPTSGDLFRVPGGFRLALEVNLQGIVTAPDGSQWSRPITFEFGRGDARTALSIRHATPGAFSTFASDASPIVAGVHTGFFANVTDTDDYSFRSPANTSIQVVRLGATPLDLVLYDADGLPIAARDSLVVPSAAGQWTLRVKHANLWPATQEYAFLLRISSPEADEGLTVGPGTYAGTLGPGDASDTYTVFVWKAQRVDLTLTIPDDASYRLSPSKGNFWNVTQGTASGTVSYSGRAVWTGYHTLVVERVYGNGTYQLGVQLDAQGNLSQKPMLVPQWYPAPMTSFRGMVGYGNGVDVGVYDIVDATGDIEHLTPTARELVLEDSWWPLGRTQSGALIHGSYTSGESRIAYSHGSLTHQPLLQGRYQFAFASDGTMFTTRTIEAYSTHELVRTAPDGSETTYATPGGQSGRLLFTPAGVLYFVVESFNDGAPPAYRVDLADGTFTRAPQALDGLSAFDHQGRAYRVLNRTLVERYDPVSREQVVVARADFPLSALAFGGDHLFAMQQHHNGSQSIATLPLDGFSGFTPPFAPWPTPDLVGSVEEVAMALSTGEQPGESRTLRVVIENAGAGDAAPTRALVTVRCHCPSLAEWRLDIPALAAGAAYVVELEWVSAGSAGEYTVIAMLDSDDRVVEADERNNRVTYRSMSTTGPARAACHEQLDDRWLPVPSLTGQLYALCDHPRH